MNNLSAQTSSQVFEEGSLEESSKNILGKRIHRQSRKNEIRESESESEDSVGSRKDENRFKGALKITRIKNRRYIRMPNFPKKSVGILKNWLNNQIDNPYPTYKEKDLLSRESGLSKRQIQNWFTNARKVPL